AATVTDPAYLTQRISAGDPYTAESDLARAAAALPSHDLITWWRGWIARHSHLLAHAKHPHTPGKSHRAAITPTQLALLSAAPPSPPRGRRPCRAATAAPPPLPPRPRGPPPPGPRAHPSPPRPRSGGGRGGVVPGGHPPRQL